MDLMEGAIRAARLRLVNPEQDGYMLMALAGYLSDRGVDAYTVDRVFFYKYKGHPHPHYITMHAIHIPEHGILMDLRKRSGWENILSGWAHDKEKKGQGVVVEMEEIETNGAKAIHHAYQVEGFRERLEMIDGALQSKLQANHLQDNTSSSVRKAMGRRI